MLTRLTAALAAVPLITLGVAACSDDAPPSELTGVAAAGEKIVRENGCIACHGADYQGGTGPSLVGLAGSTVTLDNGSKAVADGAYLTRALKDPAADQVAGFVVKMPPNTLNDDQIAQVVEFLKAIAPPAK